ncbi:cytochrome c oxidase assembly protein [Hyphomicrobium sp.]|uniref:cytochrome c oxidase assembly protein n=1 Tax=Hyphomicrobium sp. TaxID=82 RepID=UPI0025B99433|nr:cytochrome c oxidase assembly protein [Hyphomicrobium sp.]MCC7252199.1 cytochrome c oxidase assembly protein [Hyphomicrobium sp.]
MTTDGQNDASAPAAEPKRDPVRRGSNRGVVLSCLAALLTMGAMTWAAVPLYRLFCQVTGYGGTPMRADKAPDIVSDRTITVRFDANVAPGMPWTFEPVQRTVQLKLGESMLAFYKAHNTSNVPVKGTASFNVSPDAASVFFSKIECFCFTEQTLAPGESVDMPVSFFVDPSIATDRDAWAIKEITLSYTFYPVADTGAKAEAPKGAVTPEEERRGG